MTKKQQNRWMGVVSGSLIVASAAAIGTSFVTTQRKIRLSVRSASAVEAPAATSGPGVEALHKAVDAYLDRKIELRFGTGPGSHTIATTLREAGVVADEAVIPGLAASMRSKDGAPILAAPDLYTAGQGVVPVRVDRVRALAYLIALKDELDQAPADARIDMEKRSVIAERMGVMLRPYETMSALETAARAGAATSLELTVTETAPKTTLDSLKGIDISTVMGSYETPFSTASRDSDRTYNLKVAAEKVSGHILMPGQEFSFNEVVGDRTEKEGYRVAPVIQAGELVDGLAGGACQISSTLHAAAFFAGLDIVSTRPHSRPSGYIHMGLDSTVVYPTTDLKLRNNFEFPVVFYYQVNQGRVRVEVLGKERPYKVSFNRTITRRTPFEVVEREVPEMPLGQRQLAQAGVDGFHIIKKRIIKDAKTGKEVRKDTWVIDYPPTTEYVKVGTNADPLAAMPPPEPPHPAKDTGRQDSLTINQ